MVGHALGRCGQHVQIDRRARRGGHTRSDFARSLDRMRLGAYGEFVAVPGWS